MNENEVSVLQHELEKCGKSATEMLVENFGMDPANGVITESYELAREIAAYEANLSVIRKLLYRMQEIEKQLPTAIPEPYDERGAR